VSSKKLHNLHPLPGNVGVMKPYKIAYTCSILERCEKYLTNVRSRRLSARGYVGDLQVCERIILNRMLTILWRCRMDFSVSK
jgi:hypothetical protein